MLLFPASVSLTRLPSTGIAGSPSTWKTTSLTCVPKGDTEVHVCQTVARIRAMLAGCEFKALADIDAGRAAEWLTCLRQTGRREISIPSGMHGFTPAQAAAVIGISGAALRAAIKRHGLEAEGKGKARKYPRRTVEAFLDRMDRGCGPQTVNHYVRAVRGFFRWMVRAKRIGANPLETLPLLNTQSDIRRGRRELTADELRRLLAAARSSTRMFRGLAGEDRSHLYLTAATTGFRASALPRCKGSSISNWGSGGAGTRSVRRFAGCTGPRPKAILPCRTSCVSSITCVRQHVRFTRPIVTPRRS